MGAPYFQMRELVARHDVAVFSSNHGFFADMSWRFQSLLFDYSPRVEHYSIDEAWLEVQPTRIKTLTEIGRDIHKRIFSLSGIPVSVGLAETKVLAKVALELAKTSIKARGVLDLTRSPYQSVALEKLPVSDVWGIGSRYAERLNKHGLIAALDLREADDGWIRKHLTVVGLRIVHELRGIQCFPICPEPSLRKMATVSRSFGQATTSLSEIRAAVAWFTARAAEKLRCDSLVAGKVTVWLETDRFRDVPQYSNSVTFSVSPVSNCTWELTHLTLRGLERIFRPGYDYRKAGVVLSELETEACAPRRLWEDEHSERYRSLMRTMDEVNTRFGRDALHCGIFPSSGIWRTKTGFAAPGYTIKWQDIVTTG